MQFAVIGDPIGHSRSPLLYRTLFERLGIDASYDAITVPENALALALPRLRTLSGFNVTMPHKETILPYCKTLSPDALEAGSVNTVLVDGQGNFHGYSTDGEGFARALQELGHEFADRRVILLGAGGAAKAVALCTARKAKSLTIATRDQKKAEALLNALPNGNCALSCGDMKHAGFEDCDILINATPLGMRGQPPFSDIGFISLLPSHAIVCDMVYNPADTELLTAAKMAGLAVMPGLSMLLWQGVAAFILYTGIVPDFSAVAAARRAITAM